MLELIKVCWPYIVGSITIFGVILTHKNKIKQWFNNKQLQKTKTKELNYIMSLIDKYIENNNQIILNEIKKYSDNYIDKYNIDKKIKLNLNHICNTVMFINLDKPTKKNGMNYQKTKK